MTLLFREQRDQLVHVEQLPHVAIFVRLAGGLDAARPRDRGRPRKGHSQHGLHRGKAMGAQRSLAVPRIILARPSHRLQQSGNDHDRIASSRRHGVNVLPGKQDQDEAVLKLLAEALEDASLLAGRPAGLLLAVASVRQFHVGASPGHQGEAVVSQAKGLLRPSRCMVAVHALGDAGPERLDELQIVHQGRVRRLGLITALRGWQSGIWTDVVHFTRPPVFGDNPLLQAPLRTASPPARESEHEQQNWCQEGHCKAPHGSSTPHPSLEKTAQIPTNGPQPRHFDPYPTYPQQRFMLELPYNPYSQEDTEKG